MARKRTATLLCPTEENLTVLEFFAVGRIPTAVLLRAVKGGVPIPQTKNICNFQGSSGSIFLSQFFINHLTLSIKNYQGYLFLSDYIVLLKLSYNHPLYIESLFFYLIIHHILQVAVLFSLLCNQ